MNPAMTWEKFWSIIDRVRAQADMQDEASVKQFLYTELIKLPQDELLGFDCAWQSYRNKANFPRMVAAACIINDGSSDDRFTDFRNWLIMQGYDAYRQALIDKIHFPLRPQHTGQYSIRPNAETDGNRGGI